MEKVVVLSGVRTAIGGYGGSLRDVPVYRLGGIVLAEAARRAKVDPAMIDDVIMGSAYQNGECANGARMAVLDAGWPDTVPGVVLDRRCCSGLDSIFLGAMKIQTGNAEIVAAGGMDSMSQAELYIPGDIKWGLGGRKHEKYGFMPKGHGALAMWGIPFYDRIQRARVMSQPIARYGELSSMMSWAEVAAKREGITREEADRWAIRSHQRAIAAWDAGKFVEEIVPVPVPGAQGGGGLLCRGRRSEAGHDAGEDCQAQARLSRRRVHGGELFVGERRGGGGDPGVGAEGQGAGGGAAGLFSVLRGGGDGPDGDVSGGAGMPWGRR